MWKKIKSKIVFEHPRLTVIEDTVQLPGGQEVPYLKYGSKNNSVAIICIKKDKVLLQLEYSYPPNETLYQLPGGKMEKGETIPDAVRRELIEEAGLEPLDIKEIGWLYPDNRRSSSKMFVVLVKKFRQTVKSGGDIEEEITSAWVKISDVNEKISDGVIHNYSILAGWSFFTAFQQKQQKASN